MEQSVENFTLRIANEARQSFEPARFTTGDTKSIEKPEV